MQAMDADLTQKGKKLTGIYLHVSMFHFDVMASIMINNFSWGSTQTVDETFDLYNHKFKILCVFYQL